MPKEKQIEKNEKNNKRTRAKKNKPFRQQGLFMFPTITLRFSMEEREAMLEMIDEYLLELMYMHQAYHDALSRKLESQYALRGSKIKCSYGTKTALLDCVKDHGVLMGSQPVSTCRDCGKSNIYNFGSCMCPERLYMSKKDGKLLPMTGSVFPDGREAKKARMNSYAHICVPLMGREWLQEETDLMIEDNNVSIQALVGSAVLTCHYGGLIRIVEVPEGKNEKGELEATVCCTRAIENSEPVSMRNADKFVYSNNNFELKNTDAEMAECFQGCLSCNGECTIALNNNVNEDIEEGIWQEYNVPIDQEKDTAYSNNFYMICKKGGGLIYFSNAGQELLDVAERLKKVKIYVTFNQLNSLSWENLNMDSVVQLNETLNKYNINTTERIRHFLAQCMKETGRGACRTEGDYIHWASLAAYQSYYDNNTKYGYKYRGAGYIQITWDYAYLAFATYLIKKECPNLGIDWKSPANTNLGFKERYEAAVEKAENAQINIAMYKKIVDEGADYVAEYFGWEAAGYFWEVNNLNNIVDGLVPADRDEVDRVTDKVNYYTGKGSREDRKNYYDETVDVIK